MGYLYEILSCAPAYARRWTHKARYERGQNPVRIQYGPLRHQAIVLYEPKGTPKRTTVAYLHGGAYVIGDPDSMGQVAAMFNTHDYRFASIGFSLMQERKFPAQIDDVFDGLACLVNYLDEHGIPSDRICIGGSSAGGHAAATVAYGKVLQCEHGFDGSRLTGCISLAAVVDIDDMLAKGLPLGGGTARFVDMPQEDRLSKAKVHAALTPFNPMLLISEDSDIPFLGFHGTADKMSPYDRERAFVEKLNALVGENPTNAGQILETDTGNLATLHTMTGWSWQHMKLTVTLPIVKSAAAKEARNHLFAWLDKIDAGAATAPSPKRGAPSS